MSIISVRNLEKHYADNIILQNIDADIEKGEVISIIGPSGAGKSTLFKYISYNYTSFSLNKNNKRGTNSDN